MLLEIAMYVEEMLPISHTWVLSLRNDIIQLLILSGNLRANILILKLYD